MESHKNFNIIAIIIGIILIISGLSKAASFNYFSGIINNYISWFPDVIVAIIIVTELTLGIMLIFALYLKITSLISFCLILLFTLIYTYGLIYLGIHDCGCFGQVKFLNFSPVFLYIRNLLILLGLVYVYNKNKRTKQITKIPFPVYVVTIMIISLSFFLYTPSNSHSTIKNINKELKKISFKDSNLNKYIDISSDSTYLIYLFSYDCPHCINSMGNLMQYDNKKYIDKLIGISKENSEAKNNFIEFFNPSFEIIEIPEQEFYNISEEYPVTYFIINDSVIKVIRGEIPSAFFLKH